MLNNCNSNRKTEPTIKDRKTEAIVPIDVYRLVERPCIKQIETKPFFRWAFNLPSEFQAPC